MKSRFTFIGAAGFAILGGFVVADKLQPEKPAIDNVWTSVDAQTGAAGGVITMAPAFTENVIEPAMATLRQMAPEGMFTPPPTGDAPAASGTLPAPVQAAPGSG